MIALKMKMLNKSLNYAFGLISNSIKLPTKNTKANVYDNNKADYNFPIEFK